LFFVGTYDYSEAFAGTLNDLSNAMNMSVTRIPEGFKQLLEAKGTSDDHDQHQDNHQKTSEVATTAEGADTKADKKEKKQEKKGKHIPKPPAGPPPAHLLKQSS